MDEYQLFQVLSVLFLFDGMYDLFQVLILGFVFGMDGGGGMMDLFLLNFMILLII